MERRGFLKTFGAAFGCALCASGSGYAAEAGHSHWSYEGAGGPDKWGDLNAESKVCGIGSQQSPLDIKGVVKADLPRLKLGWKPLKGEVVNNGHTIQINTASGGRMTVGNDTYELVQFHFHAPSEHRVEGKNFPMEVHFVHQKVGSPGSLGVLGVFIQEGGRNEVFSQLMRVMPAKADEKVTAPANLDLATLVPKSQRYWSYEGSLTTPPCSEVVDWRVCVEPISVPAEDIRRFTALYPMNARPLQPLKRRFLLVGR